MKTIKKFIVVCLLLSPGLRMQAQYCNNAADTVYSLTASGRICYVNVNNATSGPSRDSTGTGINANGLGYSSLNGSFYFFNRCNAGPGPSVDSIQFVRYIPSTKTTQVLADPPATFTAAQKIRSGCMNNAGNGYYTINPGATGGAALYYYSIGTGTWTTITQTFKNRSGVTIANVVSLNSGDMAFDGTGNLWLVSSSSANYTLYKISAPIPTVVTANLVVDTIIAEKPTPAGASITGIAFNSAGKLYMSTGAGAGAANNKFYELSTATGTVTLIGSLLAGYGDDLTSCSYPGGVLTVTWVDVAAALQKNSVQLEWTANELENVTGYSIEFSTDAERWQTIGYVGSDKTNSGSQKKYKYVHRELSPGGNYYRISQLSSSSERSVSPVKFVNTHDDPRIQIGPNPARDVINVYNRGNGYKYVVRVCDKDGRIVYSTVLKPDQPSINVGHLQPGLYVLKLYSSAVDETPVSYRFIKL